MKSKFKLNSGVDVIDDINSKTAGAKGPIVISDTHLIEKLAHFNRERIPERIVHAKGAGAYGEFVCDPEKDFDITKYTRANFLSKKGLKTEVFARFSTVGGEKGSADSARDPRGFAIKFYTKEGNYDLVGNNTPVFFIRDPLKFPDFIHTQKRNPQTNRKDANMFWDFLSLTPESMHQVLILFSNYGTPYSYRHTHGYGSHTFMWYTDDKNYYWVKYHFVSNQGRKELTNEQATKLAGENPDFHTEDLFDAIERKKFPSWTVYVQILNPESVNDLGFDPFDVTKIWPHKEFPLKKIGVMTLNKNPLNYFADVEQAAFSPSNFVPGIDASPDKMLQGRLFAYPDAHRYRIGPNFHQLPVNAPKHAEAKNYQRDGIMWRYNSNSADNVNYFPNSFEKDVKENKEIKIPGLATSGFTGNYKVKIEDVDFVQPRALYQKVMTEYDRNQLILNIAGHLKNANKQIQDRQLELFARVDKDFAKKIASKM